MMTRFEDEDYNTLVLTFDKNSDIVTFENDIKEAEELGLKYLFRVFISFSVKLFWVRFFPIITLLEARKEIVSASSIKDVILISSK